MAELNLVYQLYQKLSSVDKTTRSMPVTGSWTR